jgi:hypothetical protein
MESSGRRKLPPKNMFYEVENWSLFCKLARKLENYKKTGGTPS